MPSGGKREASADVTWATKEDRSFVATFMSTIHRHVFFFHFFTEYVL